MYNYAVIDANGICIGVKQLRDQVIDANHIVLVDYDESILGQHWTGSVWETAPPTFRQEVTASEFVELWTDAEWRGLKNLRSTNDRVDQFFDAIQFAGTVDLASAKMTTFLSLLVANTPLNQARADEIQAGILE